MACWWLASDVELRSVASVVIGRVLLKHRRRGSARSLSRLGNISTSVHLKHLPVLVLPAPPRNTFPRAGRFEQRLPLTATDSGCLLGREPECITERDQGDTPRTILASPVAAVWLTDIIITGHFFGRNDTGK